MKKSRLQQSGTDNSAPKGGEQRPPAPQVWPRKALTAYAEKWNRDPADNFVTHCIKEYTLKNGKPDPKKNDPGLDLLAEFQTVEWNAITLVATKMDETEKKEKLSAMMSRLTEMGNKLKQESPISFGISPITVETRVTLAGHLVDGIVKSDKRYSICCPDQCANKNSAQAALRNFEAREWQMLEQGDKAKNSARMSGAERREKEQEKLFQLAHQYFGAAGGLACDCEGADIPKEIVKMRAEQRLKHMRDDPNLSRMRNPSREADRFSRAEVFADYVNEMIEKLAKTIKRLISQTKAKNRQGE